MVTGINLNDVRALPGQGGGKNTLDDAGAGDENVAFLREVVTVGLVYAGKGGTTEPRRCAVEAEYEDIRGRYGACVDGEGYK